MKKIILTTFLNKLFKHPPVNSNEMENTTDVKQVIAQLYEEKGLNFTQDTADNGNEFFRLSFTLTNNTVTSIIDVSEESKTIKISSFAGIVIPENKRVEVAELIVRINFGQSFGSLMLDFESGDLSHKFSYLFDINSADFTENHHEYFQSSIYFVDYFFPAVADVVYGNLTPEAALNKLWNIQDPHLN